MSKLHIIVASTRPGRVGLAVAQWFHAAAKEHGRFDPALIDLAEVNLPMFNEPLHPALQQYEHEHTKRWSASVNSADAFVFVTPEYNYGPPPPLVNALNYLVKEWQYKPAGFVSYGGISGGLRSVQMTKQMFSTLKMVPIAEAVVVPMVQQHMSMGPTFTPNDVHKGAATVMLDEIFRWSGALKTLRA